MAVIARCSELLDGRRVNAPSLSFRFEMSRCPVAWHATMPHSSRGTGAVVERGLPHVADDSCAGWPKKRTPGPARSSRLTAVSSGTGSRLVVRVSCRRARAEFVAFSTPRDASFSRSDGTWRCQAARGWRFVRLHAERVARDRRLRPGHRDQDVEQPGGVRLPGARRAVCFAGMTLLTARGRRPGPRT